MRRVLSSGALYELAPRAEEGLPLPPTGVTNRVVSGVLARAQRDGKVVLHNYVWMNNHGHFLASTTDTPHRVADFTAELKKKLTDSVRALIGRRRLRLWEENTPPVHIVDLEAAEERVVYLFTNPSRAGLVDSIENYPGLSSWRAFCDCEPRVDATVTTECFWYPVATLPVIHEGQGLSARADRDLVAGMESSPKKVPALLELRPLAWLEGYGITDPKEVAKIRGRIIDRVKALEAEYRKERARKGVSAPPTSALAAEPYMKPHSPKNRDRSIFLICSDAERRISRIRFIQDVVKKCHTAYRNAREGLPDVQWPQGVFIPWFPPTCGCETTT